MKNGRRWNEGRSMWMDFSEWVICEGTVKYL